MAISSRRNRAFGRGRDLIAEGITVVPMGGARSIGRFVKLLGPQDFEVSLAGLCDAGETRDFLRGLQRGGLGVEVSHDTMQSSGFFVFLGQGEHANEVGRHHDSALGSVAVDGRQGLLGVESIEDHRRFCGYQHTQATV